MSLTYCTNCGNTSNNYEIIKVFPYYDHNISIQDFIVDNGIQQDDMILFKRKQNDQRHYDFVIYNGNIPNPNYNNFVNDWVKGNLYKLNFVSDINELNGYLVNFIPDKE